jgi:predicted SnoaL-like aldol condensation-catalyzing enzyme
MVEQMLSRYCPKAQEFPMTRSVFVAVIAVVFTAFPAFAQEAVVGVTEPEQLFTSADPALQTNKQVVYHIIKDLLEAGHWDLADRYLTAQYIQHNPNAASGREGVVKYFTEILKMQPKPIPVKMQTKVVSVTAEGDFVVVGYPREIKDPKDPAKVYTTTWFDMWRIKNGKADEHWDPATRP